MLVSLVSVLQRAFQRRYAVGSFNTANLELTQAILAAAEALQAPVIISTTEKAIGYAGIEPLAAIVHALARRTRVPVALNLDHGHTLASVRSALHAGYTGIMFDGSKFTYADNLRFTSQAARLAHRSGAGAEGELGSVGGREDVRRGTLQLTDPLQAVDFVRRTNIDALAVAIGSAHGLPAPGERLDFERLRLIRRRVHVPLVLHGASSTPSAKIRRAIALGIAKINIDTDLRVAFTTTLRRYLRRHRQAYDPREVLTGSRDAVTRVVMRKMRLFGSVGKG